MKMNSLEEEEELVHFHRGNERRIDVHVAKYEPDDEQLPWILQSRSLEYWELRNNAFQLFNESCVGGVRSLFWFFWAVIDHQSIADINPTQ